MLYGVDSANPSTDPASLKGLGWSFACGYIGGRALHTWTADDWRRHDAAGLKLGPIWVSPTGQPSYDRGVDEGNKALVAMQSSRLSGNVLLDVENGAQPEAYINGFVAACHAGQCSVGLYGSRATLAGTTTGVDFWWLAEWVQSGSRLAPAPLDWSIWQYGTGPQFDYNVAIDDFPFAGFTQ